MNATRALRVVNFFFISCGYQVHAYNLKTKDFRISVLSVIFFIAYLSWYIAGVAKFHLENNFVLVLFEGVSPFLFFCMKVHLLVGVKTTLLMLIESKSIAKASTQLCQVFSDHVARFTLAELVVYLILFLNLLLCIILGIYDIAMVHPKHFTLENAVVFSAVFTPHFSVACALKYLCIAMWLLTQELARQYVELRLILAGADSKNNMSILTIEEPITMTSLDTIASRQYDPCPLDRCIDLNRVNDRLKSIQSLAEEFNRVLQKQIFLLLILSGLVFVEASYAFMYYDLVWRAVLYDNYRNAFFATFICFYIFVVLDFLLLFLGSHLLSKKRIELINYIDEQLRSQSQWSHDVVGALKETKAILGKLAKFKILFVFDLDWRIFILGGGQMVMVVALITIFQYTKQRFQIAMVN